MRKQFAIALVAILLFSVPVIVPTAILASENVYTYFRFTDTVTELWHESYDGADRTYAFPVGDLDGDGKEDVLVQLSEYNDDTGETTAKVFAKREYYGSQLWKAESDGTIWVSGPLVGSRPWDLFGLIGSGQMRGPADLNGDGTANILLGPEDKVYAV